jgi:DNA-binding transcriptional regulator YiaG
LLSLFRDFDSSDMWCNLARDQVTGDDVKALRKELRLSIQALATSLKVEARTILAWEAGDLFPTKKHASAMLALVAQRKADERPSPSSNSESNDDALSQLKNPELWDLVARLATDPEFFATVQRLAKRH